MTHAVLPAFVLVARLGVVESIGEVIEEAAAGPGGVARAAERLGVAYSTARGWWRRFRSLAEGVAVSFSALSVELGGPAVKVGRDVCRWALDAIEGSWEAAAGLPGWLAVGRWRFASAVSGGRLIATNTDAPLMIVGRRRFMPPVP
ncbi:MAG: helix-turn-helix domain-containing protein [Acidimicrobiales bacterium]